MKYRVAGLVAAACLAVAGLSLGASKIELRDGTVVVGEIRKIGNSYQIVKSDGSRMFLPVSEVLSIDGHAVAAPATAPTEASKSPAGQNANAGDVTASAFKVTKSKADKTDAPIVAVQLWDAFIEKYPNSPFIDDAKKEREGWDKLYKDKAERVNGKWVGGQELKDLKKKCDDLFREAVDQTQEVGVRGEPGMRKLEEVIKLYPKHFGANFEMGFYNLVKATRTQQGSAVSLSKALTALERTSDIAPTVPEVWCNLAIGYNFTKQYQKSIECAYKAVQMRDEKKFVEVLANAIYRAPQAIVNVNPKIREINELAQILFRKYGVGGAGGEWFYYRPTPGASSEDVPDGEGKRPPGVQWTGSGFFVTNDGYLITNHHVAASDAHKAVPEGITWRIRLDDGTELPAELVQMDEKADIAVMKVKTDKPTPFLKIAEDNPEQGSEAMVLGYPATFSDAPSLQISKGTVKSVHSDEEYHVWFDLNTTHGNSGGPIIDRDGRCIGILTAGGKVYDMMYVFGVGPNQIENFMKEMGDKAPKVQYEKPITTADGVFLDSLKLTRECRGATVYVMAISGAGDIKSGGAPGGGDAPSAPSDPGGGGGGGGKGPGK